MNGTAKVLLFFALVPLFLPACARLGSQEAAEPKPPPAAPASEPSAAVRPGRADPVLVITVHGLTPDAYLGASPAMPNLAALARAGIAAERLVPVYPPAVVPAHVSIVTGRTPRDHRVIADRQISDDGVLAEPHGHVRWIRGVTLWQLVGAAGDDVGALDWPVTIGADIADLLPAVPASQTGKSWSTELAGRSTPRVLDAARRAGAADPASWVPGTERDAVITAVACGLLQMPDSPRLLLLRLSQTQAALQTASSGSPQMRAALGRVDADIAQLRGCLELSGRSASSAIVVIGDFGTAPVHTAIRPNAILEAVGLLVAARGGETVSWDAIARSNGGSAFVYARNDDAAMLARRALRDYASASGAYRLLSADEMEKLGADRDAWFGLVAEPGFYFEDATTGRPVAPAFPGGVGGYPPDRAGMTTGFVAYGNGLRSGVRVPELHQTDIAPTLARLLGVRLDDSDGRVMIGLLAGRSGRIVVQPVAPQDAPPQEAAPQQPGGRTDGGS